MGNRRGWAGRVPLLMLLVAAAWMIPPEPAHAQRNVTSLFDVRLGGYIQTNGTWDSDESPDSANSMRDFAIEKGADGEGRDTFRLGAFRTRLFMDIRGPEILWGAKTRGFIETDFDGLQTDNSPAHTPRLRRAYFQLAWPMIEARIGQDTLLFTSAVGSESEISAVASGRRGDITAGSRNRVPQLRLKSEIPAGPVTVSPAVAVSRNAAGTNQGDSALNDSGSRADIPVALQGMGQVGVKLFGRDAIFAVSGYWGEERLVSPIPGVAPVPGAAPAPKIAKDVNNQGLAVEALIPIGPVFPFGGFDVRGNYFKGENMHRLSLGANNSGLTSTDPTKTVSEIGSEGWWAEATWAVTKDITLGGGYGRMDDDLADIIKAGGTKIDRNEGYWIFARFTDGPFMYFVQFSNIDTTRIDTATLVRTETDSQEVHFIFRYTF